MHPDHRRRPRTAERLKLLYIAVAVSWLCTLVWWLFNVETDHVRQPPPRRGLPQRPLVLSLPPPAPDDAVSRAWRLRNEVLVDEHERSSS